jgi:hypothetical protein
MRHVSPETLKIANSRCVRQSGSVFILGGLPGDDHPVRLKSPVLKS